MENGVSPRMDRQPEHVHDGSVHRLIEHVQLTKFELRVDMLALVSEHVAVPIAPQTSPLAVTPSTTHDIEPAQVDPAPVVLDQGIGMASRVSEVGAAQSDDGEQLPTTSLSPLAHGNSECPLFSSSVEDQQCPEGSESSLELKQREEGPQSSVCAAPNIQPRRHSSMGQLQRSMHMRTRICIHTFLRFYQSVNMPISKLS